MKPDFFTDEDIGRLSPLHRIAFQGLWCHADKAGRLEDRPARLKVQILPFDDVVFSEVIDALEAARFVNRYDGRDGRRYLQIRTFLKHQRPRPDEPESTIPCQRIDSDGFVTAECLGKERKGEKERNGTEGSSSPLASEPPSDDEPVLLKFPTVGSDGPSWRLRRRQVEEWQGLYPGLDVLAECRKALAWVGSKPDHRKTGRGMPQFLVRWLNRAVDNGGPRAFRPPGSKPTPEPERHGIVEWVTECQARHGGTCVDKRRHLERLEIDRANVSEARTNR